MNMKRAYSKEVYNHEVRRFKELTNSMYETFKKKRNDYGPSSYLTFELFGPDSMSVRMFDKLARYSNLANGTKQLVNDESIKDTLLDLANYALITILELEHKEAMERKSPAFEISVYTDGGADENQVYKI